MFEQIRQAAVSQAMKVMSSPTVTKMIADPRVTNAFSKGLMLQQQIRTQVTDNLRSVFDTLRLASKEEVVAINDKLSRIEESVDALQNMVQSVQQKKA
jgi:hypothetical protein